MINIPDLRAVGTVEKTFLVSVYGNIVRGFPDLPVVSWPIIRIGRGKHGARLSPAGTQRWVTTSVPGQ